MVSYYYYYYHGDGTSGVRMLTGVCNHQTWIGDIITIITDDESTDNKEKCNEEKKGSLLQP